MTKHSYLLLVVLFVTAGGCGESSVSKIGPIEKRKQTLKKVGNALHRFHYKHSHLPTASSQKKNVGEGLSWRVHILPFLEEENLYRQFKLDEPWDSEHNKKLIEKMPGIYKDPERTNDGKTTIHVFVGERTIFGNFFPTRLRSIRPSSLIMCVVSGDDKADVWTRPGGLRCDHENSCWDAVGNIGSEGLLVVMTDGSIKTFKKDVSARGMLSLIRIPSGDVLDAKLF